MNMVPMLNVGIFITNKHDSNARLALEHRKHVNLVHALRLLGPLSSANTIPMLGYATTANIFQR